MPVSITAGSVVKRPIQACGKSAKVSPMAAGDPPASPAPTQATRSARARRPAPTLVPTMATSAEPDAEHERDLEVLEPGADAVAGERVHAEGADEAGEQHDVRLVKHGVERARRARRAGSHRRGAGAEPHAARRQPHEAGRRTERDSASTTRAPRRRRRRWPWLRPPRRAAAAGPTRDQGGARAGRTGRWRQRHDGGGAAACGRCRASRWPRVEEPEGSAAEDARRSTRAPRPARPRARPWPGRGRGPSVHAPVAVKSAAMPSAMTTACTASRSASAAAAARRAPAPPPRRCRRPCRPPTSSA